MVSPETFKQNMSFLVVLLIGLAVFVALLIAAWTGLKIWLWHCAVRAERKKDGGLKFRPDGRPYPPSSRGICDACGGSYDKVYFLDSHQRVCPACFQEISDAQNPKPA